MPYKDLFDAITDNNIKKLENILRSRKIIIDVVKGEFDLKLGMDFTPLLYAAYRGFSTLVEILIHYNADVNQSDENGETSLHLAALHGHVDTVRALLRANADVDKVNRWGETSLHKPAMNGHVETVRLLLEADTDVNRGDRWGETPLHYSSDRGHSHTVIELLRETSRKTYADINASNVAGQTPLHKAVQSGHRDTVSHLLQYGADAHLVTKDNQTALQIAESNIFYDTNDIAETICYYTSRKNKVMFSLPTSTIPRRPEHAIIPFKRNSDPLPLKPLSQDTERKRRSCPCGANTYKKPVNSRPTEKDLNGLSMNIGFEWRSLAFELGVSHSTMQQLEMSYPNDAGSWIREMLLIWRNSAHAQEMDENARMEELKSALASDTVKRNDLANQL